MFKFIIRLSLFTVLSLIFAMGLDVMISKGLLNIEDYKFQVYNDIFKGDMNHEVLIMGNSRAFSHYNPRIIDSICDIDSYNIGIGGAPINVQIAEYHCYKYHNTIPKVIVLEVDHITLFTLHDVKTNYDPERFLPTVYDSVMRKELKELGYGFWDLFCPLYRYFGNQMYIKKGLIEFLGIKHIVMRPVYKCFSPEKDILKGQDVKSLASSKAAFNEEAVASFEDFLNECRDDGVYVLLVSSPLYIERTRKEEDVEKLFCYYDSIAQNYGYDYLNYTNDELCYDTINFAQTVHLNAEGADKFSIKFAENLKSLHIIK